jgi:hypothetical protein
VSVHYEWVIERLDGPDTADDDAEILDVDHAATWAEASARAAEMPHARIGLVRDSDRDGRAWAYVENDVLPPKLEDAFGRGVASVPARFVAQFEGRKT